MTKVTTESQLGKAVKEKKDVIEIEGSLADKTFKIRATGKAAWIVAVGAIGVSFYAAMATAGTGGTTAPITGTAAFMAAPVAVGILGATTSYSAIAIAVAAGSIGVLTSLREYEQVSRSPGHLVLKRRR